MYLIVTLEEGEKIEICKKTNKINSSYIKATFTILTKLLPRKNNPVFKPYLAGHSVCDNSGGSPG